MRVASRMGTMVARIDTATTTTRAVTKGAGLRTSFREPPPIEELGHRLGERQARAAGGEDQREARDDPHEARGDVQDQRLGQEDAADEALLAAERPDGSDLARALDDADDERVREDEGDHEEDQAGGEVDEGLQGGGDLGEESRRLVPSGRRDLEALGLQARPHRLGGRVVLQSHRDHRVARDGLGLQRRGVDHGRRLVGEGEDVLLARGREPPLEALGQRAARDPGEVVHPGVGADVDEVDVVEDVLVVPRLEDTADLRGVGVHPAAVAQAEHGHALPDGEPHAVLLLELLVLEGAHEDPVSRGEEVALDHLGVREGPGVRRGLHRVEDERHLHLPAVLLDRDDRVVLREGDPRLHLGLGREELADRVRVGDHRQRRGEGEGRGHLARAGGVDDEVAREVVDDGVARGDRRRAGERGAEHQQERPEHDEQPDEDRAAFPAQQGADGDGEADHGIIPASRRPSPGRRGCSRPSARAP